MTVALYIAGIWKSSALRQGQHGVNKFSTRKMFQKKSYCSCTPKSRLEKTAKKQNKPLAPYKCMGNLCIRRRSSCQLCPHRYWESQRCSLTCARRVYVVGWVCKEPAPSSIASVTSAIVKSAMVIGYRTAPKQLWPWPRGCGRHGHTHTKCIQSLAPVIIGAHGSGMLFHIGGGIRGGTISSTAATIDCTIPIPIPRAAP